MKYYIINNLGVAAMSKRVRILDSRYLEFIEYLQKLGELQSIKKMITNIARERSESKYACKQQERDAGKMMYSFWQRGWIEIREIEKKRENGLGKDYVIKVRLKKIVEHLGEEKLAGSAM